MRKSTLRWLAIMLCAVFVIVSIASLFVPHSHDCVGTDCILCTLRDTSQRMLAVIFLVAAFQIFFRQSLLPRLGNYLTSGRDGTLVGLMVKLSD